MFRAIPTNQRIPAIKDGKVDMVVRTMTINCDRLKDVAFSTAYFQAGQQVLAPKGSTITGYDKSLARQEGLHGGGLDGATTSWRRLGATKDGTTGSRRRRGRAHRAQPAGLPGPAPARPGGRGGHRQRARGGPGRPGPGGRTQGRQPFTTESYGVAMKLGDDDLVRRVNSVLDDYRKGGGWTDVVRQVAGRRHLG